MTMMMMKVVSSLLSPKRELITYFILFVADEDFAPGSDSEVAEEFDSEAEGSSDGQDEDED